MPAVPKNRQQRKTKTWKVQIDRIGYASADFTVKAIDENIAEALAFEEAATHEFSDYDADYRIASCHEIN